MAPPLSVVLIAQQASDNQLARAASSLEGQVSGAQLLVTGASASAPLGPEWERLELAETAPHELRNAALAHATAPFVTVVEGHEWFGPNSLQRHVESLRDQPELVASYGRVAVHELGRVRVRPEQGRGGAVFRRLLREKHLVAASAALIWRREALAAAPYPELTSPPALRLALALELARAGEFAFHATVVAERDPEQIELVVLEEFVRVLCGVIYDPALQDEKIEERARVRLARYLVAIGKLHYREADYPRAGRFFDEAVKAAPGYFKGRRYQFLNFVKTTLNRES